ncbi:AimR family lysis-lysogeny pheromone receptor [Shouchella clausii]|uniref:AimR family lysis-lysogeny pheromone receptor n=1 Tax=Shouchella clausii TaxID=79880 RepID=UPI001C73BC4F|nr:AimR family lysis-lysogeny pheromone receptor [Shouchella clausii]MBX0320099.1 AimR family lysis-lysogeny pheromone receptor [Shouchella clausii]MEB5480892.1 AimR family lysis-lysogeny pheromone receptor [Shouchella clausii]
MEYVYNELTNWMKINNKKQVDVVNGANLPKALVSRLISTKGQKKLEFGSVLSLFRFIEPEYYLDKMDEYCMLLTKPIGILNALEFAHNFQRVELTNNLLAEHSDRKGDVKNWLKTYALQRDLEKKDIESAFETIRELYGIVEQTEVKIRLDFIEHSLTFRNNNYSTKVFLDRIKKKIDLLPEGYLKESFKLRYYANLSLAKLYEDNDPEMAIKYGEYIVQSMLVPDIIKAPALHMMGHAYIQTSPAKSKFYITQAAETYRASGSEGFYTSLISNDIPFVQNINNEKIPLDKLEGEELAHQYIVRRDYFNAAKVLRSLKEKTAFHYIYLGIAEKNLLFILKGYGILNKTGNVFLAQVFENKLSNMFNIYNFEEVM